MTTTLPTFQKGTEYYAAKPPLRSPPTVIRVAEDAGTPGLLYTGPVRLETVGEVGRGRRKHWLHSDQLHDSPTTASGKPRTTGYIRLQPGQTVPTPRSADTTPSRISDPEPGDLTATALRDALDDADRSLKPLGLSLDGSPATWAPTDTTTEWAHRAGQLLEKPSLLAARIEPRRHLRDRVPPHARGRRRHRRPGCHDHPGRLGTVRGEA